MIKLKPIVENLLQEADDTPTWGEVKQVFAAVVGKTNKNDAMNALKSIGKVGLAIAATATGVSAITAAAEAIGSIGDIKDVARGLFSLGKTMSNDELKNPKSSEFKQLTAPFWNAVRLDPEVSIILDDKIEKQFIDQVILPKLKAGGNDDQKIPNMNYELGKWLNSQGLKNSDIFFKGKAADL